MLIEHQLAMLEQLAIKRNPLLLKKLNPGLPENHIRRLLRRHAVDGDLYYVIAVYRWKNGTILDSELVQSKTGLFPGTPYHLLDLEMALGHLNHTKVAAKTHVKLVEGACYFPLFWDGSTCWITTDIRSSSQSRVMIADHRADVAFREGYATFQDFVVDAIHAIERNQQLLCFRKD